jgi:hypothetical protein
VGLVLLTRAGEFRQKQFNALHDQIDVGFPRIGGARVARVCILVNITQTEFSKSKGANPSCEALHITAMNFALLLGHA